MARTSPTSSIDFEAHHDTNLAPSPSDRAIPHTLIFKISDVPFPQEARPDRFPSGPDGLSDCSRTGVHNNRLHLSSKASEFDNGVF